MVSLNEDAPAVETTTLSPISLAGPYVGMEFDTADQAKTYYKEYGKARGFSTWQRDIKRNIPKSDQIISVKYVCAREGKQREIEGSYAPEEERFEAIVEANEAGAKGKRGKARTSSSVRMGCNAYMRVFYDRFRGRYVVSVFNDAHNHEFVTSEKRKLMRKFRNIPTAVKKLTESFQAENI